MASGGAHNVEVVGGFGGIGLHGPTKDFVVTVCTEAFCKSSVLCAKEIESITNVSGTKSFQCKHPIIPGCLVDKYQTVSCSSYSHDFTETYVDMDLIEVAVLGTIAGLSAR